jgi:hypothetical protein
LSQTDRTRRTVTAATRSPGKDLGAMVEAATDQASSMLDVAGWADDEIVRPAGASLPDGCRQSSATVATTVRPSDVGSPSPGGGELTAADPGRRRAGIGTVRSPYPATQLVAESAVTA